MLKEDQFSMAGHWHRIGIDKGVWSVINRLPIPIEEKWDLAGDLRSAIHSVCCPEFQAFMLEARGAREAAQGV